MSFGPPTTREVRKVARRTSNILEEYGLHCCLIGSAATSLWGTTKVPNDLDVVVMTDPNETDPEDIKDILESEDGRFIRRPSRFRNRSYTVLEYCLPGYQTLGRKLKVDILVSGWGNLDIPRISWRNLIDIDDIPVMPILPLLFLKMEGWDAHRMSPRRDFQAKEEGDIQDVEQLLDIACEQGARVRDHQGTWILRYISYERALDLSSRFLNAVPSSSRAVSNLGFYVS